MQVRIFVKPFSIARLAIYEMLIKYMPYETFTHTACPVIAGGNDSDGSPTRGGRASFGSGH